MALISFDGFDHYNSLTDLLARSGAMQWQQYGTPFTCSCNQTAFGVDGKCIQLGANALRTSQGQLAAVLNQRIATWVFGARILSPVSTSAGPVFFMWDSNPGLTPTMQCSVFFNPANYSIEVWNGPHSVPLGGTLLFNTANNVWAGDTNNMIEIQCTVSAGAGVMKVIVNGVTLVNLSGINTKVTANNVFDSIGIKADSTIYLAPTIFLDDFYVCDTTVGAGTYPCNVPLGDVHCYTRFPIGNNSVAWTPLSGANWQNVDEVPMDSDTTYNFSATPGQEDILNFASLAAINNIVGVQVTGAYRKDDAASRTFKQLLKSGATKVYGATNSAPTIYTYFTDLWVLDPATAASWTLGGVNGLSAGYNCVS